MALPNFFIVGAAKSGTTALYRYLRRHPEIYLPAVKEPRFFSYDASDATSYAGPGARELIDSVVKDRATYESLYEGVTREKAVGDASPSYLVSPIAARRISETVPDARIIAVLRDPVERAYSHFVYNVHDGWEDEKDFERVLALREQREREHWWRKWDYVGNGFYHEQLSRYFEAFEPDRIQVHLYEDLRDDPRHLVGELLRFLGVDPAVPLDVSARYNASGLPKSERLNRLLSGPNPVRAGAKALLPGGLRARIRSQVERRNLHKPEMSPRARALLCHVYRDDVSRLEQLIGRDLSSWCRQGATANRPVSIRAEGFGAP
jgi:hypothetical protein